MITYRLADALPAAVVCDCKSAKDPAERRKRLEASLDAGYGSCLLRRADIATTVVENWERFHGARYGLLAWVVMPNHVHVLVEIYPSHPMSRVVHSWKSYTAKAIARRTSHPGKVWQEDYWDRAIRSEKHFAAAVDYIVSNPVAAGLVVRPEDWPWSSARAAGGPPALPG